MVTINELKFDEAGLIPCVVQEFGTGKVLTVAYMNRESLQISMAYLAAGLTGGSKGFLVYNLPGCDGRSFYNFSRFTKFLSEYEEILYYGKRSESDFKLQGLSPECGTVFTLNGKKRIALSMKNGKTSKS